MAAAVIINPCWTGAGHSGNPTRSGTRQPLVPLFDLDDVAIHLSTGDCVWAGIAGGLRWWGNGRIPHTYTQPSRPCRTAGVASRAHERVPGQDAHTYLLTSIMRPTAFVVAGYDTLMPETFGKTLSGEEIDSVVAYLMTLE